VKVRDVARSEVVLTQVVAGAGPALLVPWRASAVTPQGQRATCCL
jgi:hypothetical protein